MLTIYFCLACAYSVLVPSAGHNGGPAGLRQRHRRRHPAAGRAAAVGGRRRGAPAAHQPLRRVPGQDHPVLRLDEAPGVTSAAECASPLHSHHCAPCDLTPPAGSVAYGSFQRNGAGVPKWADVLANPVTPLEPLPRLKMSSHRTDTLLTRAGNAAAQRSTGAAAAAAGTHQPARNGPSAEAAAEQPAGVASHSGGHHPATPEEWVDAFVASMAEARDVADARQRAARLLHAFQQVVASATGGQVNAATTLSAMLCTV